MRGILKLIGVSLAFLLFLLVLTATFSIVRLVWFGETHGLSADHVEVVDLTGIILTSSSVVKDIQDAAENKHTKAIVLRVNSPGGVVAPSQEIYEAVKRADKKVPVVVSMGSVAASGGYYIALGGRKIFANPGTMTASIGVIMEFMNTQKLYQWAKMDRFSITSGKFKDAGSPLKPMSAEDKALFQSLVNDVYAQFRNEVKVRRKLSEQELDKVADGRVVTGTQALKAKLVDAVGGFEEALAEAKVLAKLPENAPVAFPEKSQGLLRKLILGDDSEEEASSRWWNLIHGALGQLNETLPGPSWRVLWLSPVR